MSEIERHAPTERLRRRALVVTVDEQEAATLAAAVTAAGADLASGLDDAHLAVVATDGGVVVAVLDADTVRVVERSELTGVLEQLLEEPTVVSGRDELTGLAERTLFLARLDDALLDVANAAPLAVLLLDLDRFKLVNASFGRDVGDALLRAIAELLASTARPGDLVARLAGDRFALLCLDVDGPDSSRRLADRLTGLLARPFAIGGREVTVSTSIGIALASPDGRRTGTAVLRDAEAALAQAKRTGRARAEVFDDALRLSTERRVGLGDELRAALRGSQLELHYQPQVELATGRIVGLEALLRWPHPELGFISPDEFVPIAEETGLIRPIGSWTVAEAVTQLARWRQDHPDLRVSVNLSSRQLDDPALADTVAATLDAHRVPASALCLEITESVLMDDADASAQVLRALDERGLRLAIDDFGTGYSSLASLKRFPVDEVKVDRAFVAGLGTDPEDTVIVTSVLSLAQNLDLDVVAEGVETAVQLDELARLGCGAGQGYLWSRAVPPSEVPALLARAAHGELAAATAAAVPADRPHVRAESGTARVGDVVAAVAHELRTPITVIRGAAEMLPDMARAGHVEELELALAAVTRQTQAMELLVNALVDANAVDRGGLRLQRERLDVVALVDAALSDLRPVLGPHPLELALDGPVVADVDPARLRQVVGNLVGNAAKFSPPDAPVLVAAGREGDEIVVRVVDRGPGVPPSRIGELFKKFSRLGSTAKGTGLGLYLSRHIARAHGGELSYRRAETGGAEFVLRLPLVAGGVNVPRERALVAEAPVRGVGDDVLVAAVERATRALLRVAVPEQAVGVAVRLVAELGGRVCPLRQAPPDALPFDVSLGVGDSLAVVAEAHSVARMRLERVLPAFLEDAAHARSRCSTRAPGVDPLTGLLRRTAGRRALEALARPAALAMLSAGPDDEALVALARALHEQVDERALMMRWDEERLLVAVPHAESSAGEHLLDALRARWLVMRPHPVPLLATVATLGAHAPLRVVLSRLARAR